MTTLITIYRDDTPSGMTDTLEALDQYHNIPDNEGF
jgi:hypothetical protein